MGPVDVVAQPLPQLRQRPLGGAFQQPIRHRLRGLLVQVAERVDEGVGLGRVDAPGQHRRPHRRQPDGQRLAEQHLPERVAFRPGQGPADLGAGVFGDLIGAGQRTGRLPDRAGGLPHIGQQLPLHMGQQTEPGREQIMQILRSDRRPVHRGQQRRQLRPRRHRGQPVRQPPSLIHNDHNRTTVRHSCDPLDPQIQCCASKNVARSGNVIWSW